MLNHLWPFPRTLDARTRAHLWTSTKKLLICLAGAAALYAGYKLIPSAYTEGFSWPYFLVNSGAGLGFTLALLFMGLLRDVGIINRVVALLSEEHISRQDYEECLERNLQVNRFYWLAVWLAPVNVWLAYRYMHLGHPGVSLEPFLSQLLGTTLPLLLAGTPLIFALLPKEAHAFVNPNTRSNTDDDGTSLYYNAYTLRFYWAGSYVATTEAVRVALATLRMRSINEGEPTDSLRFAPKRPSSPFTTPKLDVEELGRQAMIAYKQRDYEREKRIQRFTRGINISDYVPRDMPPPKD